MSRLRPWRTLLLLLLLSLVLTWPLLPHIFSHVPGDGIDDPALAWNLWWAKYSWIDRAGEGAWVHNPFVGDAMFYPIGINLAFYTLTLANGALSIPLQAILPLTFVNNLLLLSSFVLSGFGAYLLAQEFLALIFGPRLRLEDRRVSALVAGLVYAFASTKLFYAALGQFNIASSQWLPFLVLYLLRSLRPPWRWRDGLLLGVFLLLQTWAELTFGVFGVLLIALTTLGVIVLALSQRLLSSLPWGDDLLPRAKAIFANATLAAAMFILGLAPYLANMLPDMAANGDFLVEGGGFSDIFSADLLGFFLPTQLHPLLGHLILHLSDNSALRPDRSQFMVNKGQHIFLGYTVMALALLGLWKHRRQLWAWGLATLTGFFLVLSWGPSLRFNGYDTGIPGLFPLLQKIPFLQANRYPSRYSIPLLLGVGLLASVGFTHLQPHLRRKNWATLGIIALLLFEHLSLPLPLSDFRLPPAYKAVVADPRPGAILDLPIGWRNGFNVFGKSDTIIMYTQWYQTYHHKPRLGGNTSRNPEQKFQYFMENPVVGVLAALENGHEIPPGDFLQAQTLAPDLLRTYNIHTVLLRTDKVPPDFSEQLQKLFPLEKVAENDGIIRYEARWPAERTQVTLTAENPELKTYLDQGWGTISREETGFVVWATRPRPQLILPGFTRASNLTLKVISPGPQLVDIFLDGDLLVSQMLHAHLNTIALHLPASPDGAPRHLQFHAHQSFTPRQIHLSPRLIGTTGVDSPVHIVVRSAGKETGDFGHIYLNGEDVSPNQRGYNLAALAPDTGTLLGVAVFDTHAPYLQGESARLADWIASWPSGTIIAGAVRDAAALNLSDQAVAALHSLGVHHDIRGELRRAHAFVGVKDAPPDSAAELISDQWPLSLSIGDGLTETQPTFALLELSWQLQND